MKDWTVKVEVKNRFCSETGAPLPGDKTYWIMEGDKYIALVCSRHDNPSAQEENAKLIADTPRLLRALQERGA